MLWKDVKLEKRSDDEPKFNPQNKTDRKIVFAIVLLVSILIVAIAALFIVYFLFFFNK